MTRFKIIQLFFYLSLLVILTACNSDSQDVEQDLRICPQCNMELPKSNLHTAILDDDKINYFDDVGCLVIWTKDNNIDLKTAKVKVFSNDTKRYIDAAKAFYSVDEKTPMLYGFSAYENKKANSISFDEVIMKMLRGEHMANPKIRKQILGY